MRKPAFCICENKDTDQLCSNCAADQRPCFRYTDSTIPLLSKSERTSFHKGVFLGPEYFNNILGTNSHIKGTCIAANFESNEPLAWCLLSIKRRRGNSIPVLPEVTNYRFSIFLY